MGAILPLPPVSLEGLKLKVMATVYLGLIISKMA